MQPLVSILIPAFNAQEYLAETLASAIAQTWPRKEIIVIDDGSTDRTLEIAQQAASSGVRVVAQEHLGAAAARNNAFALSQGDFIQWLDADDLLSPDKIERQLLAFAERPRPRSLLSCPWGSFIYRRSRARFIPTALWQDLSPLEWLLHKMEQNVYLQTATWLVSRELTESAGAWDTRILGDDDGEYFCRVLLQSDGVRFVPAAKVLYRMSGMDRLSYIGGSHAKMESQFRSMRLHIGYVRSLEDSPRVRAACISYLQRGLSSFHSERADIVREAELLAAELGGRLQTPRPTWKYSLFRAVLGHDLARRAQTVVRRLRWSLAKLVDKSLSRVE
jgi:glycosyltransferase involved in cell wall biosynthesis